MSALPDMLRDLLRNLHLAPGDSLVAAAQVADLARAEELAFPLPDEDEARIARYVHESDRAARRAAWRLARRLVGAQLGRPPQALTLLRDDKGRPELCEGGGLDLNVSHSGGYVAVGLAQGGRIGVDVEQSRPLTVWADLVRFFLDEEDAAGWADLPPEAREAAALAAWCRKEAVLKATGEGLAGDPRTVRLPHSSAPAVLDRSGRRLSVAALSAESLAPACLAFAVESVRLPALFVLSGVGGWSVGPPDEMLTPPY